MSAVHQQTLAVPPEASDHSQGPEDARLVVVEYGDFECPSCKVAAITPTLLLERFPGQVRFIFRHFPLEQAHPHAVLAAEAAEAAAAQGRFWQMYGALFSHQAQLEPEDLARYAADLGMDAARYAAAMDGHVYLQKVRDQAAGGVRSRIRSTPAFFVDGIFQDTSFGMQGLHDAVAAKLLT